MKKLHYFLLVSLLCWGQLTWAQSKAQVIQNNAVAEGEQEVKLRKAWSQFADALIHNDMNKLKALSMNCIYCTDCYTDSETMRQKLRLPDTLIHDGQSFFSADHFFTAHKPAIFDQQTLSRLNDPAMLDFHDNAVNASLYASPCMASNLKHPGYKEVLLLVVDPSLEHEGAQQAFAFIETKEGYKFCGYSTIP